MPTPPENEEEVAEEPVTDNNKEGIDQRSSSRKEYCCRRGQKKSNIDRWLYAASHREEIFCAPSERMCSMPNVLPPRAMTSRTS